MLEIIKGGTLLILACILVGSNLGWVLNRQGEAQSVLNQEAVVLLRKKKKGECHSASGRGKPLDRQPKMTLCKSLSGHSDFKWLVYL